MSGLNPPADLATRKPRLLRLAVGTVLHRFYSVAYEPIYFDRSNRGRLNDPAGGYGVLYLAGGAQGAFAETFLRTPGRRMIDPALRAAKAYVTLETTRPLNLIDFDGPGLPILGATAQVVHGGLPYDEPQAWSVALHAHPIMADGIAYTARHDPKQACYALFDRSAAAVREKDRQPNLDDDWFWRLLETYEMGMAP